MNRIDSYDGAQTVIIYKDRCYVINNHKLTDNEKILFELILDLIEANMTKKRQITEAISQMSLPSIN